MYFKNAISRILISSLLCIGLSEAASRIRAGNNNFFVDDGGRVVILRGLNVVGRSKTPDFMPFNNLGVLDSLASLGTNVARLPFIWEAYEPVRGQFNTTYYDYYQRVVEYLYNLGILTIVDFHEDGFSRFLGSGCGAGFPAWTVPWWYRRQPTGQSGTCTNWVVTTILDPANSGSWEAFHNNEDGVRDAFLSVWNTLSATFAGNPAILGYDIVNEPMGSERRQIQPMWEDAAKVIRKNDPDAILFLSPLIYLASGGVSGIQRPNFTNYVISVHYYNQNSLTGIDVEEAMGLWFKHVYPWGAPIFVGEFGAQVLCPPSNVTANTVTVLKLISGLYNFWDANFLGWAQWLWTDSWNSYERDGWNTETFSILNEFLVVRENYMIRPYPRAIAGIPVSFKVLERKKAFQLVWNVTEANLPPRGNARTVVYAPAIQFFGVESIQQLNITSGTPEGREDMCSYVNPARSTIITCTAAVPGTHYVRVERIPGAPAFLRSDLGL